MRRRAKRALLVSLVGLAGCAILFAGFGLYTSIAVTRGSRGAIFADAERVPPKPVAIVFGAKVWSTQPSDILRDRLDAGIRLYKLGKAQKLLLSGDHGREKYDEVNAMREYALAAGVAEADLFLDHAGFRTYDTLYRARDVFGVTSAVLVTNEFHLPRAVYTGRRLGLDVVGLGSDRRVYRTWLWNNCREFLARTLAWTEVNVTRPRPKFLGPHIDITEDGRVTHDKR